MTVKIKHNEKAKSVPAALMISASVSIILTLLLSAFIAYGLNTEYISWEQAGYWIMGMLLITSFIGCKYTISALKRQKIVVSALSGILYWGILLLITALFFGGDYDAEWVTAGVIMAGSGCAVLLTKTSRK